MPVRGIARYAILCAACLLVAIFYLYSADAIPSHWRASTIQSSPTHKASTGPPPGVEVTSKGTWKGTLLPDHYIYNDIENVHRRIYSASRQDGEYFVIDFGKGNSAYNPNIIPHKRLNDSYYIVAQQQEHSVKDSYWFAEWVCIAKFVKGRLTCDRSPSILPIAVTSGEQCTGDMLIFSVNVGPHDARVFYGPTKPYAMYGSNSHYACFGQYLQDFRVLVDWGGVGEFDIPTEFRTATEMYRPPPVGKIEKNFFVFWDADGELYNHVDITPNRSFAKLDFNGTVGEDLAPLATGDAACLAKYIPTTTHDNQESIHQATNSLSITMCKRSDPECKQTRENTFIFTLFHHKSYYSFHSNYEPYLLLFSQSPPFEVHSISTKPFWIHGRGGPGQGKRPEYLDPAAIWDQTEMMYVTSIAWATHGLKYHGFLDDVVFLAFGIEDSSTGGIDVVAGDLFQDLGSCAAAG